MSIARRSKPHFHEEQRFRQPWLWVLLVSVALIDVGVIVFLAYGMVQQLVFGRPWGDNPVSDRALTAVGTLSIVATLVVSVGLLWAFHALRLITEVTPDGLHVRFAPFVNRHIAFEDIEHCEARQYSPIREYGGWGIRWGRSGKAYNVSGNWGVQLTLRNGKRLLIGSQDAKTLARAIEAGLDH